MPLFRPGWTAGALWQSSGCLSRTRDMDKRLLIFFREWHQGEIATNRQRLVEAFPGRTIPRQLPNAKHCYEETTQKQTVCLNIIICRYLFRLKTYN